MEAVGRRFEVVEKYQDAGITLPQRATAGSAGYDLAAAERTVIPSFWRQAVRFAAREWGPFRNDPHFQGDLPLDALHPVLVSTGVKVKLPKDEVLIIACRSSNPVKRSLTQPNGIGVIDSDYYNNPDNEGEIFVQLMNFGMEDYVIEKGDRIGQGIFVPYGVVDDDQSDAPRLGGFGSSGD